jgi:tetratricopeptide (TPR) repeat protein
VDRARTESISFAGSTLLTLSFAIGLWLFVPDPFPPLSTSLSTGVSRLHDFVGLAVGARRLAADIAWIQTLQYYGTVESDQTEFEFENGIGNYPHFLSFCQRVARIDPYFIYVYYYGAAALGWNLNRLSEAEELLRAGIRANPKEWRLQQYLAAMAYQKSHDQLKLAQFLEAFVIEPDCPNLLRNLLANIYKKQKRYADALRIWGLIYETRDPAYSARAVEQIRILGSLGPLTGK